MKKIFFALMFSFFLTIFLNDIVLAQNSTESTSSATAAPLDESEMKNVKKIIDLVASSSAEQKLTERVGVIGTVAEKTNTTINLKTLNEENKIIDIDEITKFNNPDSKSFGISDIKNGDVLGVIGVLNKISNHILARFVDKLVSLPSYFEGVITEIDRKNFQYIATDENGNKVRLDIQTSSKISSFTKEDGQVKSGFSKAETGQRVYASGYKDAKINNQLQVSRIILFPNLPLSSKLKAYAPSDNSLPPTASPTNGAKK